jgi:hypothetical protein
MMQRASAEFDLCRLLDHPGHATVLDAAARPSDVAPEGAGAESHASPLDSGRGFHGCLDGLVAIG